MGSYMWDTTWFVDLVSCMAGDSSFQKMQYQACMHGGDRDKRCTLLCQGVDLTSLALMCDKSHSHKPWGLIGDGMGFATAEERQYPLLFCARLAAL
eukprot:9024261-Karenia_brevis.AAC.1